MTSKMIAELDDICTDFAEIQQLMMNGMIPQLFTNRNLSALGPGSAAKMLAKVIYPVGFPAMVGQDVPVEDIKTMQANLISFADTFGITAMEKPLKRLEKFLAKIDAAETKGDKNS